MKERFFIMADLGYNYKTDYNGYTFTPYLGSEANGANDVYSFNQTRDGGINYFHNGTPVTNTEFGQATGADYNKIEGNDASYTPSSTGYYFKTNPTDIGTPAASGSGTGTSTGYTADDIAYLRDQQTRLQSLLGRTNTSESQGLQKIGDEYNKSYQDSQTDKTKQLGAYDDQRVTQNEGKLNSYNTINQNAGNGYRSLAQIIGRASGTGSSAFRDLLPNVVGKDTSIKRRNATETYGKNLQGIDKSQNEYISSFEEVLQDLQNQKKSNEDTLRRGVESQRQDINSQLGTVAGQIAQGRGGGYNVVHAAQQPYEDAINNSRNSVESFFNQFKPSYTPKKAVAAAPELSTYTTDRSAVNAQNQGIDPTNAYASLLRKKLQETA